MLIYTTTIIIFMTRVITYKKLINLFETELFKLNKIVFINLVTIKIQHQ